MDLERELKIISTEIDGQDDYLYEIPYVRKDPKEVFESLNDERFVFFDIETTGLEPGRHQITEIAAMVVDDGNFNPEEISDDKKFFRKIKLSAFTKILKKLEGKEISDEKLDKILEKLKGKMKNEDVDKLEEEVKKPIKKNKWTIEEALEKTGYKEDEEAVSEKEALEDFKDFCEENKGYLVAQYAPFDIKFVEGLVGEIPKEGIYDTNIFAQYYLFPFLSTMADEGDEFANEALAAIATSTGFSSSLEKLAKALDVDINDVHTAIGDVESIVKIFGKIKEHFSNNEEIFDDENFKEYNGDIADYRKRKFQNKEEE